MQKEKKEIILEFTIPRTGTRFLEQLFTLHQDIYRFHCSRTKKAPFGEEGHKINYLFYSGNFDQEILKFKPSVYKYLFIKGHWFLDLAEPILFMPDVIKSKSPKTIIATPLRHPFSVERSCLLRGGNESRHMRFWHAVLQAIGKKAIIPVPLDLLGQMTEADRLAEIQILFDFLDLEISDELEQFIRKWEKIGKQENEGKTLTEEQSKLIEETINFGNFIKAAQDAGIPYGNSPEEPIGTFTFNDFLE